MTKNEKILKSGMPKKIKVKITLPIPCEINGAKVYVDPFLIGPTYEENCL